MFLVLYCHNIGKTEFSFFETEDFDVEEGYTVRGKWPNTQAFLDYLPKEFPDLTGFKVIDLTGEGPKAESYSQQQLQELANQLVSQ
ncbi:hypothetical protein ACFFUS_09415 [Vibrio gallaecicus]|uniref:Uncharacterized protein n=2 Tax=Vibrio TaxID=662 RepID=A0ABV4N950_9VIBR|nr:hypothetical protein [Vibrio gallaecicus]MDN3616605.1 hypothetical protein [Vibrio gallaecicus]